MDGSNLVGTRLGKYEIHAEIGRGGMGAVYKGYDPLLDRWVAVKVLAPHLLWEQKFVQRFLREARAAARLKHPGIVTVYDVGQEAGWYYIVMEYLEGRALTELIQEQGPMPLEEAVRVLRPLAEALDHAHHKGLVHRDVKPGNVMIGPEGQVTLTDFGVARAMEGTRLTGTGTVLGTPAYMSPEQARGGSADLRSDQYSLGVVAYEVLAGQVPFEADSTLGLLYKIVHEPPPPLREARPDLRVEVERVLERALAKDPGERYGGCAEFVDALERAGLGVEVVVVEPEERAAPSPPPEPAPEARPAPQPSASGARAERTSRIEEAIRGLRSIPRWGWALGGLAALALVVGVVIAGGGLRAGEATPAAAVTAARATSTLRPTSASPAGGSLASYPLFVSNRDGKREIYRLGKAGTEQVTHTPGDGESWEPVSGLRGAILFTSDRDGKREIYRLGKVGVERVTHTPGDGESWGPVLGVGGAVLFTSDRDGKREIYRLGKAGLEQVTHTPGEGGSWGPVLEPGGAVLFTSDRDGKREMYRLGKAGTEQVTHTPGRGESWLLER